MFQRFLSRRGQAVMAEYVVGLLVVVAAVGFMIVYVKRTFQAKVKDAQLTATARASSALPGVLIPRQYEPYYAETMSNTDYYSRDRVRIVTGGEYNKEGNLYREGQSLSTQYPPSAAN